MVHLTPPAAPPARRGRPKARLSASALSLLLVVSFFLATPIKGQSEPTDTTTTTSSDPPPTTEPSVQLEQSGCPMAEADGAATITARLNQTSTQTVTITLAFQGTAAHESDYSRSSDTITIAPGATTGTASLAGLEDGLDEADETVLVDIASASNAVEVDPQRVSCAIADDDPEPTVQLAIAGSPLAEEGGTAIVTATLSAASGRTVTVQLGFGGAAEHPADYTRSGASISIAAGGTSGSVTLTAVPDEADEPNEAIEVAITGVTNGLEEGDQQATATITDDDDPAPTTTTTTTSTTTSSTTTSSTPTTSTTPTSTTTSTTTTTPTSTTTSASSSTTTPSSSSTTTSTPTTPTTTSPTPFTTTMTTTDSAGQVYEVVQTFGSDPEGSGPSVANHSQGFRADGQRSVEGESTPNVGPPLVVLALAAGLAYAAARRRR